MSIKCITVGVRDDVQRGKRIQMALDLAKRFEAHLDVVYLSEPVDMPAGAIGRGLSLAYLEEARETARERREAIRKEIEQECEGLPSWAWHEFEGELERAIAQYMHLSDLAVLRQPTFEYLEDQFIPHLSDYVVSSAACPMVLVPQQWTGGTVGEKVLVAWKNQAPAASAVRSALPFLHQAKEVLVLADPRDPYADPPGSDLVTYLGRHRIEATLCPSDERNGEAILATAQEQGCDLIVMGAYAHSRLREVILGGATDYIMRHTTIPVLMRH